MWSETTSSSADQKALGTRNVHRNKAHEVKEASNEKDQHGSDTVTEKVARLKLTIGLDLGNSSRFGAESEVSL